MENFKTGNTHKMRWMMDAYLSKQKFEKDLNECLTIIKYPSQTKTFYVCEHISASLEKRMVNVHVE